MSKRASTYKSTVRFGRKALVALSTVSLALGNSIYLDSPLFGATPHAIAQTQGLKLNPDDHGSGSNSVTRFRSGGFKVSFANDSAPGTLYSLVLTKDTGTLYFPEGVGVKATGPDGSEIPVKVTRSPNGGKLELLLNEPGGVQVEQAQVLTFEFTGSDTSNIIKNDAGDRLFRLDINTIEQSSPLDLSANPGDRDPLFEGADPNKCMAVQSEHTGTKTWIAESFYSDGEPTDSLGPRNIRRNYTVLQYREDKKDGATRFTPVSGGGISPWVYNALAYNQLDGFLYAVSQDRPLNGANSGLGNKPGSASYDKDHPAGQLLRISPVTGNVEPIGAIDGLDPKDVYSGMTNGTFDWNGNYIFANNSGNGTGAVYTVKFDGTLDENGNAIPDNDGSKVRSSRPDSVQRLLSANDWAFVGFERENNPFVWSINSSGEKKTLYRINTDTGRVDEIDVSGLHTPSGQYLDDGIYGNAWTYPNGNLGFSVNQTGNAFQIAVDDPKSDKPGVALVSKEKVPTSYNNDAASNAFTVTKYKNKDVDLQVSKNLQVIDGKPQWVVEITNNSDCASTGFTLSDRFSSNIQNVKVTALTDGWISQSQGKDGALDWTHGPLPGKPENGPAPKAVLRIDAEYATREDGTEDRCVINKASVIGYEGDPDNSNNADFAGECFPELRIRKLINGVDAQDFPAEDDHWAQVDKGGDLEISYEVTNVNSAGIEITGITISDVVTAGGAEAERIQEDINAGLEKLNRQPFSVEAGKTTTITLPDKVKAANSYASHHRNSAFAVGTYTPAPNFPDFDGGVNNYDPHSQTAQPRTIKSNDDEANAETPAVIEIEKRINGRSKAVLASGEGMEIWYRVKNPGETVLTGITVQDEVPGDKDLETKINGKLKAEGAFSLQPGAFKDIKITLEPSEAPTVAHTNIARPSLPPVTIPGPTVPVATVPASDANTPPTTLSSPVPRVVTVTSTPTAQAEADRVGLKIQKLIQDKNGAWLDAESENEIALLEPGADLKLKYIVTNSGTVDMTGIRIQDVVEEQKNANGDVVDQDGLTTAIQKAIDGQIGEFDLAAGETQELPLVVKAGNVLNGYHRNYAVATAPATTLTAVEVPGTRVSGTTVPPVTLPETTIPAVTVPEVVIPHTTVSQTVVTPKSNKDYARSTQGPSKTPVEPVPFNPAIEIEKRINGRTDAVLKPGDDVEIWYRVRNTGDVRVDGVKVVDQVKSGANTSKVQADINRGLASETPFPLEPGEVRDVKVTIAAPEGKHVNEAIATAPVVVPGTTNETTTVEPSTSKLTAPPATARANSPKLEVKKYIRGTDSKWRDAEDSQDAAPVKADGTMDLRYVISNTGSIALNGVVLSDEVAEMEGRQELQNAINSALKAKLAEQFPEGINLEPGAEVTVELAGVQAPKVAHTNVAKVTAPPVTATETVVSSVPGTTDATTTVPGSLTTQTTTVKVTPNQPTDKAQSTPTTDNTPPAVVPKPQFAVEKLGNQSGIELNRNETTGQYEYSAEYTIRVRNTGSIAGEHAKVWDVPVRGVGFNIDSVTVDGTEVKPDSSRYLISDKAELAVGEYKDFQVVVKGTVTDQAANALPAAVGQCDAVTADNPGAGDGLVNVVTMEGDSDGRENNIVCEPVELRRLNIEKRIDGRENAPVTPGEKMEIWYRVRNTGNVTLSGITLADQIKEDNPDLQKEIDAAIAKIEAFDLAPGEVKDITFPVTAYEGEHTNEVRAQVPETTVPGTTRPETSIPETTVPPVTVPGTTNSETTVPETTIPGSTVPATTIPGTTVPERPVPGTTVTATAHANSPKLEIKKYINGYDEGTQVAPGEDMEILYRVSNTGSVRIDGIRLADEVTEAADENTSKALQRDIDAKLNGIDQFALEPGEVREFRITVPAPAGGHVNVAKPIVPPVTVPATTIPGTTNPNTTIPASTVPSTVVTVTTPSDDARSDSPILDIKKYINNVDDGDIVNPGDDMVITYRVFNKGNVDAKGVTVADEVTEGSDETKTDLTKQIEAELAKVEPFDVPAGGFHDVEITVKAPAGGHVNVAKPNVPPVTVPATTIPGTTNPRTTIPETTVPERVVTQTTTPSDDARSDSLKLEILKDIFSLKDNTWHAADTEDDAAVVDANGQMRVRYTVTNTGSVTLGGIDIVDNVTRLDEGDQQELTDALNAALAAEGRGFTLKPGEKKVVEITVDAPKGYHVNEAIATAPAVPTTQTQVSSVPGTTDATTTVPGSLTTTVVTTEKTPNVPTNTAQATPTTSATTPVPPPVTETTTAPAPERPQFAVEKLAALAGNVELTRNDEGSYDYSNEYVIRVRNSGLVAGEHATIWDVPLRGAGFTVNEVTVDEKAVDVKNGRYKVADAAELEPGEYKDYKVTVTGTLAEAAANNLPEAVGQCTAEGANPGADSGLVNVVNMDGDTDGPGNNVVCTPVELRRLNIEKRINGREDASVTPGQPMEIWYRVRNTGNVELTDIALADQIREDNQELQDEINEQLAKEAKPFKLAPGAFQDIRIEVTAPEGEHVNEARAEVPETTVPESTRPGTTIPGTTGPSTTVPPVTIPGTTVPGRNVPGTTVSTTARANSPLLEVKKFINGRDEHALVNAGEDMDITYRVTNKGTLPIDGIRLTDEVKEDNAELQQAIDAQLGKVAPFALEPGESMDVTVTVKAPAGRHDNVAGVTVPPVTIPATTIPGTTNPHTTVPETVVPSTVVTVTAPPDDASSDSPQLEILKEIKRADEGDDAWRDAETEGDALPIGEGETMELRYTVTNTGSVKLDGVDIVDNVTRLDGGDADEFTAEINKALESVGRGLSLDPGASVEIVIEVTARAGYHVNEAIATAPPVTATETVVSSIPGTTNETTTVPGSFVTETTVVERTPNTPTNKAQSTPTTGAAPCDCEVKTVTETPDPVTTTLAGELTTVTPDPVTSEVTITETPEPVTSEVTTTETPEPVVTTVVETHEPVTVTQTTPVTTVHTVTPEPQTLVTTVEGPTVTETPQPPARVVVIVDEGGNAVTTVMPTPRPGQEPGETETVTYTLPATTVTEVPTTLVTTTQQLDEGNDILGRCVANAVRSPILYMVPLLLAGQVLGEVAGPYVNAINEQFNRISAEIQDEIRRKTPNFGYGRRGHENEQVAELRAKAEAANRMLQELAMRPDVQQYGQWAAIAAGVVVAGSVLYDWCSNEAGEAFTAIGPNKGSSVDEVRVGGSSLGGDRVTTVVPPVTNTPGRDETGEDAGDADAAGEAGSSEGSSAGSSEGSSN